MSFLVCNPLVSIVIPVYNGANYLKECIESALAQTYNNIEVVVVNDGSTDNGETERIALSYGARIRYFSKSNGGVATALNYGIEKMEGDWFSWLSHDDLYLPRKVELQISQLHMANLSVDSTVIACRATLMGSKGAKIFYPKKFRTGRFSGKAMFRHLVDGNILNGCALLVPRKALVEVGGFNHKYRFIQDWVCWLELALRGYEFYVHNDELVRTRIHTEQDSKRLAHLYPIEQADFLSILLERLKAGSVNNSYYLLEILHRQCSIMTDKAVLKQYYSTLSTAGYLTGISQLRYYYSRMRGAVIIVTKLTFRAVLARFYRR